MTKINKTNMPKNSKRSATQSCITGEMLTVFMWVWDCCNAACHYGQNHKLSLTSGGQNLLTSNSQRGEKRKWSTCFFFSVVCCGSGDHTTGRIQQPRHLPNVSAWFLLSPHNIMYKLNPTKAPLTLAYLRLNWWHSWVMSRPSGF